MIEGWNAAGDLIEFDPRHRFNSTTSIFGGNAMIFGGFGETE
jgi:uncharacterized protein YbaA (DUF1428 family)